MRLGLLLLVLFTGSLPAFSQTRAAFVDFAFDGKKVEDREAIRPVLQRILAERSPVPVMSADEIQSRLLVRNHQREGYEAQLNDEVAKLAGLKSQLEEAKSLYAASQFPAAESRLLVILKALSSVSRTMDAQFAPDVLQYLAACAWFSKNEKATRTYLAAVLDLDPLFVFDSQKFPPPIVEVFAEMQLQARYPRRRVSFQSEAREIGMKFLGRRIELEQGANGYWSAFLPIGHPVFGNQSVLVEARDSISKNLDLNNFPTEVQFESLLDQQYATQGLFGVINNSTPSPRLVEISKIIGAKIYFLGDFIQDLNGGWIAKAQWFDLNSLESSQVLEQGGEDLQAVTSLLMARMVGLLNPQGIRPEALLRNQIAETPEPVLKAEQPLYKKWWFWTAVGVAAVGAGVGSYFLLSPSQQTKFRVERAP